MESSRVPYMRFVCPIWDQKKQMYRLRVPVSLEVSKAHGDLYLENGVPFDKGGIKQSTEAFAIAEEVNNRLNERFKKEATDSKGYRDFCVST